MTIKDSVNGKPLLSSVVVLIPVLMTMVGYYVREGIYLRDRISELEKNQSQIRIELSGVMLTRFEARDGTELRERLYDLERILQTKADAAEIRKEILAWQERIDIRIRAVEQK